VSPGTVPRVASTTHTASGDEWYPPLLAGAGSFAPLVTGAAAVRRALEVIQQLTPDDYSRYLTEYYRDGLARFGESWHYADINTVLLGLSQTIAVEKYMEIGVRRGRSMAMVASMSPGCQIVGFDLWVENYAGMENPGKNFVTQELRRISKTAEVQFIDGDSRFTVSRYFSENPEAYFDIITVDGDHSAEGALRDLMNVCPRVKIGGAVVFDDISHRAHPELSNVWAKLLTGHPQFSTFSFTDVGLGVGFAIRKY
jgi:predicted O-methyltransferase YrrM